MLRRVHAKIGSTFIHLASQTVHTIHMRTSLEPKDSLYTSRMYHENERDQFLWSQPSMIDIRLDSSQPTISDDDALRCGPCSAERHSDALAPQCGVDFHLFE